MSILAPATPLPPTPSSIANMMKAQARATHQMLVRTFNEGSQRFWSNPDATPEQIADALGTDGKELFQLHARIGAILADVSPGLIAPGVAVIGAVAYSEDGRVRIVKPDGK